VPLSKYAHLPAALGAGVRVMVPEAVPGAWLEAVHSPDYVAAVLAARVPAAIERRIGFAVTPEVSERTRLVAGGTYGAAVQALADGWAANGAGGSHHAMPGHGAGYCVTNDLAVAAARLLAEGRVRRLAVVDLDVHQGDGTAVMFAGSAEVFTFSMHAERNFPARKARSHRDVGLPDGVGDDAYLAVLARELEGVLDAARPELVLYQGGVDVHGEDRLGRLGLSDAGIVARDRLVAARLKAAGVPMVATPGGGYGEDPKLVAARHALGLRAQWTVWSGGSGAGAP
jgi:acetoin utilization deacetylase AcuC-like enzyme